MIKKKIKRTKIKMARDGKEDQEGTLIRYRTEEDKKYGEFNCCFFCRFFPTQIWKCAKGEDVKDYDNQICEKWRYCA